MITTIKKEKDFRIEFNGSNTYFIIDNTGQVWDMVNTLRKAENRLKKILSYYLD